MFVPDRSFQPSAKFLGKARSLPKSGISGVPLSLLESIRLGWKGLPRTNTLAYFVHSKEKNFCEYSFIIIKPLEDLH